MNINFTSVVKVSRVGSHAQKAATGLTEIKWSLNFILDNESNPSGIIGVKFNIEPTILTLKLKAFNDETDQDENWEETLDLKDIKIRTDDKDQQFDSFVKNLQNGIVPQELEIWRDQVTLYF